MDKHIFVCSPILELSLFLMYETYYDKSKPYFGSEKIQLLYMDTDSFALRVNTNEIFSDSKNLKDLFDFST